MLQDYNPISATNYFKGDPAWSKAANAAIDVSETLKAWLNDFKWISPDNIHFCGHSSEAVAERWKYLQGIIASLRIHGDRFSQQMMAAIESKLSDERQWLNEANVDFVSDSAEESIEALKYHVSEYAAVILNVMKSHMEEYECERFELEF